MGRKPRDQILKIDCERRDIHSSDISCNSATNDNTPE